MINSNSSENLLSGLKKLGLGERVHFIGRIEEAKALLNTVQGKIPNHAIVSDTVSEDYLSGNASIEAIQTIFSEVNEKRESILEKQKTGNAH